MKDKFIKLIKEQLNIELKNNSDKLLNNKRNILYCEIKKKHLNTILNFLTKNNIRYEQHIGNNYWIWVK